MSLRGAQRRGNLKVESAASRGEARERKTTKSPNFQSAPTGHDHGASPKAPFHTGASPHFPCTASFTRSKIVFHCKAIFACSKGNFHCAALPCLVPGCRLAPSKIAASGASALLAMTNFVGFSGKRDSFWNEKVSITAEFHCAALPFLVPGFRFVTFKIAASGASPPPRNDKTDRFCWKTKRFSERNV